MYEFGLLDYLLIAATVVFAWRMYYGPYPPPSKAEARQSQPLLSTGIATPTGGGPELPDAKAIPLNETLRRICVASGYPRIDTFLDGAKRTYEIVIEAFAKGNMASHAYLLSRIVRETFDEAIAARKERGETVELTFIGFQASDIVDAGIGGGLAWIDVRFVGEMVSVTRDRDGRVVAGDPGQVVDVAEIWTFERELRSAEPHWLLSATDSDERGIR